MKRLLLLLALLFVGTANAEKPPYNPAADAKAEIAHALALAKVRHTPVLLIFGANWCPDCRALDHSLHTGKSAALLRKNFQVVKVDVGNFDHNLDVVKSYGNPIGKGIPAAVIVSADDRVLYATRAGELSNARHMNNQGIYGFFKQALASTQAAH